MVSVSDPNDIGDVVRRETFEITQHDDLPLTVGQLWKEFLNACCEALGDNSVVRAIGPRLGRCDPRPGFVETLIDTLIRQARTQFPTECRPCPVEQDVEEPGLEGRASFESLDATNDRKPGVLGDFLGEGATTDSHLGETKHAWLIQLDERDECRLVPRAKAVHQVGVIYHDLLWHLSLGGTAGRYKKVQNSTS